MISQTLTSKMNVKNHSLVISETSAKILSHHDVPAAAILRRIVSQCVTSHVLLTFSLTPSRILQAASSGLLSLHSALIWGGGDTNLLSALLHMRHTGLSCYILKSL